MGARVEPLTGRITASLRDANQDSWPLSAIHDAILEGERVIVNFRPDAATADYEFTCVAGIRQTIEGLTSPRPHRLLAVKYNVSANGSPGRSVRRVAEGDLDAIRPDWRGEAAGSSIREFMYDPREPMLFYVSPPAQAGVKCQISYSVLPAAYGSVGANTETTVSDLYEPMLVEWALYRLFGHDVENSVNVTRSQQHLNTFQAMMGVKIEAETLFGLKNLEHKK
jgi:hypothetical protein